jgi:ring-1,2-phenylacetyl-CoA epoxidase subunit PaaE
LAAHFYPITIKSVKKETPECVSIAFDIPDTLKEAFFYKQGQHLTLRTFINGTELRRNYSLCSSPLSNEWRIAIKQMEGGLFSTHANGFLKAGDTIDVMPPMGKFFIPLNPANKKKYVAIAAGSGITPVISIIKTTLLTEPGSSFTLVYANRNRSSIIFKEELEALKNQYMQRLSVHHIFSREQIGTPIYEGRIDAAKCAMIFTKLVKLSSIDDCFVCGPAEMITTISGWLEQNGFDKRKIHHELFTAATGKTITTNHLLNKPNTEKGRTSTVTIKLDGHQSSFKLPYEGDTILNAALLQGADLPYACKGGVCCTCKARLLDGKVHMDVNFGLEQEEIDAGYILTCQSHPLTEKIVVDFDDR